MKSTKTKLLLTALILICLTGWALAQEEQAPKRELIFETSDQQEDWKRAWEGLGVIRPKYLAEFTLLADRKMYRSGGNVTTEAEKWLKKVASGQQQALINQSRYSYSEAADNAGLYRTFWIYAVSADEARKMAEGFIEYYDKDARAQIEIIKNRIAEFNKTILDAERRIPEIEAEFKPLKEIILSFGAQFNNNTTQAQQRIEDYTKMLGLLKIDIAGYQAKVEVLRESIKIRENISTQLYAAVKQMLIEQEAELAGALARKKEIENQMYLASEYFQAVMKNSNLFKELENLNRQKDVYQKNIQDLEQNLTDPPATIRTVEVLENKVVIHPVR